MSIATNDQEEVTVCRWNFSSFYLEMIINLQQPLLGVAMKSVFVASSTHLPTVKQSWNIDIFDRISDCYEL